MYIVVRKYKSDSQDEVIQKIKEGFVPLISAMPGFISYYVVPVGNDGIMVVNLFDTEINGEGSTLLASKWVEDSISHLYSGPAEVWQGEAEVSA